MRQSAPLQMGRSTAVAALALVALSMPLAPLAQDATGTIAGRVLDTTGQPLPTVSIRAIDGNGTARRSTSTGDGSYRIGSLPDGTYLVDFVLNGFDTVVSHHVRVLSGSMAKVDATLSVTAICECVTVSHGTGLLARAGQVVDEAGRPLAYARLEVVSDTGGEVATADSDGRFTVRLPADSTWSLTATSSSFAPVTQRVSGTGAAIVFTLPRASTTAQAYSERLTPGCRCPGQLFIHPGRLRPTR